MGVSYSPCPQAVVRIGREIMLSHHPVLAHVEAKIDWMFYSRYVKGELTHGLKLHGYPCAATVKIQGLKLRARGLGDALVTIDEAWWSVATKQERAAVLDHELEHLQVRGAGSGEILHHDADSDTVMGVPASDDVGRPKMRLKPHDWQLGGFKSIALRHGEHATEVQMVRTLKTETGQYAWDFMVDEGERIRRHNRKRAG